MTCKHVNIQKIQEGETTSTYCSKKMNIYKLNKVHANVVTESITVEKNVKQNIGSWS